MRLLERFIAAAAIAGGVISASAQVACVNGNCTDTGRISSSDPLPADAYRIENGRRVPIHPGRFQPARPGVGGNGHVLPGNNAGIIEGKVVVPVVAFENKRGNLYCDERILQDNMERNIGNLCLKFTRELVDGILLKPVFNPFTRQFDIGQDRSAFCRDSPDFGQAGKAFTLNLYQVHPAGIPIDCIVVGYNP